MKQRFKREDDDSGLDSLLDTMTNVVGILVLVLIVTQMGVKDKMADITANSNVTPEQVETAQTDLEKQQRTLQQLRQEAQSVSSIDIETERQRLNRLQEQVQTGRREVDQQERQINEFTLRIESDRQRAAELEKEIRDTEARRKELATALRESLAKRTTLTAQLAELPSNPTPRTSAIRIPNPRPAPKGAQEATFICAGDKLFPLRLAHHRKYAGDAAQYLVANHALDREPAAGIDPVKFTELFTQLESPADENFFTAEYYVAGNRWPRIRLHPKLESGVEARALSRPGTPIRKLIGSLDPKKFFCRFHVLPDSYQVYIAARRTVTRQDLLAGWEPQPENWTFTTSVPGIELGPPRPKPPPPKNPPPPRKPSNVID